MLRQRPVKRMQHPKRLPTKGGKIKAMDISINGARILYTFHLGGIELHLTQTLVVTWVVMIIINGAIWFLTRDLKVENISRRQAVAEMAVEKLYGFVHDNMGPNFDRYIPLVGALFCLSVVSNLIGLFGFWSPTSDLMTELAWAIVVFILITYHKLKSQGLGTYLKGFLDPIFIMAPINVISEIATPVSMACRHFGNILSGMVISTLIYGALAAASFALFGLLGSNVVTGIVILAVGAVLLVMSRNGKGGAKKIIGIVCSILGALALITKLGGSAVAGIPWLDVGLPAVTSLYFDWFSGCIQAFIFCTLTTIFIRNATEA